jgi:FkbM family methyltransferase
VRAEPIAAATRQLPVPARMLHPAMQMIGTRLTYPIAPSVVRSRLGFKIEIRDYREHIQSYIYWLGRFEPRESAVVRNLLQRGDWVIDAGANIGWFSLLASSIIGTSGKVFAFEPFGTTAEHLSRNLALNGASNVELHTIALSDSRGKAKLTMTESDNIGTASLFAAHSDKGEIVDTGRLDEIVPKRRFKLLKIDVEGAEPKVLRGAEKLLQAHQIENILFEVNEAALRRGGSSCAELIALVKSYGYRVWRIARFRRRPFDLDVTLGHNISVLASCRWRLGF